MYPPGEYDLAGFSVGAVEKAALIAGAGIGAGDVIIGIDSSGPHSNGYSLIRKVVQRAGITVENGGFDLDLAGATLADALLAPTTIYVKPILALLGRASASRPPAPGPVSSIHGMAHITGGGLVENIIRVVPDGLGIAIDSGTWKTPAVFDWLRREGNISQMEMWRTFNCGIGYTLIVARDAAPAAIAALAQHGLPARAIGEVVTARGDERVSID